MRSVFHGEASESVNSGTRQQQRRRWPKNTKTFSQLAFKLLLLPTISSSVNTLVYNERKKLFTKPSSSAKRNKRISIFCCCLPAVVIFLVFHLTSLCCWLGSDLYFWCPLIDNTPKTIYTLSLYVPLVSAVNVLLLQYISSAWHDSVPNMQSGVNHWASEWMKNCSFSLLMCAHIGYGTERRMWEVIGNDAVAPLSLRRPNLFAQHFHFRIHHPRPVSCVCTTQTPKI